MPLTPGEWVPVISTHWVHDESIQSFTAGFQQVLISSITVILIPFRKHNLNKLVFTVFSAVLLDNFYNCKAFCNASHMEVLYK